MTPFFAWNSPPAPEALAPKWVLLPWHVMAAGAALLLMALLLALVLRALKRRRKPTHNDRESAFRTALASLDALAHTGQAKAEMPRFPWTAGSLLPLSPRQPAVRRNCASPGMQEEIESLVVAAEGQQQAAWPQSGSRLPQSKVPLEISRILRAYLAAVLADPALFETQEEFTSRHEALATLPADLRQKLCDSLARLASLKYAPHSTLPPEAEMLVEARDLLKSLHQGIPA